MTPTMSWNQKVWQLVRCIPKGRVASYGQLAAMLGFPRKARHVGSALRQLPEGQDVPWHRVIQSGGAIAFATESEGYWVQRTLLESEGVLPGPSGKINFKKYGWKP